MFTSIKYMIGRACNVCSKILYKKMYGSNLIMVLIIQFIIAIGTTYYFVQGSTVIGIVSLVALILTLIPWVVRKALKLHIPKLYESLFVIFVFGSLFLGQVCGFYDIFWWWDSIFHTMSGMGIAMIGLALLMSSHAKGHSRISPIVISVFAFMFAIGLGTIWEIFEYVFDGMLGSNLQSDGINDTMWDCVSNITGASIGSIAGYLHMRKKDSQVESTILPMRGYSRMLVEMIEQNTSRR